ncbi:Rab GTPase [Pelomyxa schiedti]|nr:Rab GTPase [Pelomyxa schiedti]
MGCAGSKKKPPPRGGVIPPKEEDDGLKIVLLGDVRTGKTCLIKRLLFNTFEKTELSIGVSFQAHTMKIDGKEIKLHIWDTAGEERFRAMTAMYYRGAAAALILYDITNKTTFDTMARWVEEVTNYSPDVLITVVGNKIDLVESRQVQKVDAESFLQTCGAKKPLYFEVSAKTGENVAALFEAVSRRLSET